MTKRSLIIRRVIDRDITDIPRFPVEIRYAGHHVVFDDIHVGDPAPFLAELKALEESRRGHAVLDGGSRFRLRFSATRRGGVLVAFRTEQFEPGFPGRCVLEGSFAVEGEHVRGMVDAFERLIVDGEPFRL